MKERVPPSLLLHKLQALEDVLVCTMNELQTQHFYSGYTLEQDSPINKGLACVCVCSGFHSSHQVHVLSV